MHKKGEMTLKEAISLGLTILFVMTLLVLVGKGCNLFSSTTDKLQAQGTLDAFSDFLADLKEGQTSVFLAYSPQGYYFVTLDSQYARIDQCFEKNCACICESADCTTDKTWCKDLGKSPGNFNTPIRISPLAVTNMASGYSVNGSIEDVITDEIAMTGECNGSLVTIESRDNRNYQLMTPAAELFKKAQEIAKTQGITLVVTSAFRTPQEQEALWDKYNQDPQLVCDPSHLTCPHMIGCAVDVCFGQICSRPKNPALISADTRKLRDIMEKAGFAPYASEYWHFEYGTQRWKLFFNK